MGVYVAVTVFVAVSVGVKVLVGVAVAGRSAMTAWATNCKSAAQAVGIILPGI